MKEPEATYELISHNFYDERAYVMNGIVEILENTLIDDCWVNWISTDYTWFLGDKIPAPIPIPSSLYNKRTLVYNACIEVWSNSETKDYSVGWNRTPQTYEKEII